MRNDPHEITQDKVLDLLRGLGLDGTDNIKSVEFKPSMVTVVRHRLNEDGRMYAVGDGEDLSTATVTVTIAIVPARVDEARA